MYAHACRYRDAPVVRPDGAADAPYCLFCSTRLGATAAPPSFLQSPALKLQPIPPEPFAVS